MLAFATTTMIWFKHYWGCLCPVNSYDYFVDLWQEEKIATLRRHLDRAIELAADDRTRFCIAQFVKVLDFTALDTSATRAYGKWCAFRAEDDGIRFMDYATQRQSFLKHLPPFSGVLVAADLRRQAEARGYQVVLGHPDIMFRSDFGSGLAEGWRKRLSFNAVCVEAGTAGGFFLRGQAEQTEILADRSVPLRGGGEYQMKVRCAPLRVIWFLTGVISS